MRPAPRKHRPVQQFIPLIIGGAVLITFLVLGVLRQRNIQQDAKEKSIPLDGIPIARPGDNRYLMRVGRGNIGSGKRSERAPNGLSALSFSGDMVRRPNSIEGLQNEDAFFYGNPDNAHVNDKTLEHEQVINTQYRASYSGVLHMPNWVSWSVLQDTMQSVSNGAGTKHGSRSRAVPIDLRPAADYKGAPNKKRTANTSELTLLAYPAPIEGPWRDLETHCRSLALQGYTCHIISGPIVEKRSSTATKKGAPVIPSSLWKIILVCPPDTTTPDGLDDRTSIIAVIIPNTPTVDSLGWKSYTVTAAEIEQATQYSFFNRFQPQTALRLRTDTNPNVSTPIR